MQLGFYELQLLVLASVCTVALGFERFVSKKPKQDLKSGKDSANERLEDGVVPSMGASTGLSSLMRKYLIVYAIVMGVSCSLHFCSFHQTRPVRRGLAARTLRILIVQRTVWVPRENGRRFLCDRLSISRLGRSSGGSMGRPAVSTSVWFV